MRMCRKDGGLVASGTQALVLARELAAAGPPASSYANHFRVSPENVIWHENVD
jgi:hypothetical protein